MSKRKFPLITGEIYHIYNRSIALQPIFRTTKDYQRFLNILDFYRFDKPPVRYSHFNRLSYEDQIVFLNSLYKSPNIHSEIFSMSLMPNHYHVLVKQTSEKGVKNMFSIIQNSYAKYFNTKYKRIGSLFQSQFKSRRIETDEQFLHVSRYIHLNPLSSYVIEKPDELLRYPWTSLIDYTTKNKRAFINTEAIMKYFKNTDDLVKFTLDHADYQRSLEKIKHLLSE